MSTRVGGPFSAFPQGLSKLGGDSMEDAYVRKNAAQCHGKAAQVNAGYPISLA